MTSGGLVVDDVTKSYGGLVAVSRVSLRAAAGEVLGVIGPNGAGKTTLIDMIAGSTQVTNGQIRLGDVVLSKLGAHEVARRGVFRTFQRAQVFNGLTVGECLRLARDLGRHQSRQAASVQDALEWAGIPDRAAAMAENLTLREQRLLEMACARLAAPSLLLLDEPVAGIDVNTRGRISEMLREFREAGVALLIVEHTLDLILEITDRLVVLNFGNKLAEGPPDQVLASEEVRRAYIGSAAG